MTTMDLDAALSEAVTWRLRLVDGRASCWAEFTEWLGSDPANSTAYDALQFADDDIASGALDTVVPRLPLAANDDGARWWVRAGAGAIAAVFLAWMIWPRGEFRYSIETAPGIQRTFTLDGGTRIALNGDTRLTLDRNNPRFAALDRGEARFMIRHDAATPFIVEVGDSRIQDLGTDFDLVRTPQALRLAVAEGGVLYNPDREAVALTAGQTLRDPVGDAPIELSRDRPDAMFDWQSGPLIYRNVRLADIAADVSRTAGLRISVVRSVAERRFTGVVVLGSDRNGVVRRLEELTNTRMVQAGDGWTMTTRTDVAR